MLAGAVLLAFGLSWLVLLFSFVVVSDVLWLYTWLGLALLFGVARTSFSALRPLQIIAVSDITRARYIWFAGLVLLALAWAAMTYLVNGRAF